MVSAKWKSSLLATLAWAGLAWGQAGPSPNSPIRIGSDLLTVREPGRPDQKCRILKTWKQPDGTMAFEVQCLETEEHLTLVEIGPAEAGPTDPTKGMKSRIYHWGQSATPPAGVPQMQAAPVPSAEKDLHEKPEANLPTKPAPDPSPSSEVATVPEPSDTATKTVEEKKVEPKDALPALPDDKPAPIQVETARPSNWHESWGKADDHRTQLPAEKISQTPATNPAVDPQTPKSVERPSSTPISGAGNNPQMPFPAEPVAPDSSPNAESLTPASLPPAITSDEKGNEVSRAPTSSKSDGASASAPLPGYSHVDDRPGIADVTDIPPPGGAKALGQSKKPVVDFLRAMWKPSLKEPAPLQSVQVKEMPVPAPVPDASQIQATLQNSLLPSRREMAAEILSTLDNHQEPTIIPALLQAAAADPAPTVRAACVHCLVKMNANSPEVVSVLMNLKADPDLRVRHEAHQALISFGLAKPEPENETIHQISAPVGPTVD
jgi:hypothetical protein